MAHDNDNITIQQFFCDNQYIRQSYNDTSPYLSNYENKMPMKRLSASFPDFGLKGLVHPKIKLLSIFTHPYVVPTL